MRRSSGSILMGIGVFLLIVGLMVRFYAYPKLAVAPIDQNSVTNLEATGATIFDTATLKDITTDLKITSTTIGDVDASEKAGGDTLVWTGTTSIRSADGTVRSRSASRSAFDKVSGMAVNCCGNFEESTDGKREAVKRSGLLFKFPFNTQKKTYPFWDDHLGKTADAKYVSTAKIQGMPVYKFIVDIPDTVVGTRDVPASVLGLSQKGNVTADSHYSNNRTLWVEPNTGAIIDRVEIQDSSYQYQGHTLTTTQGTIRYTKSQVSKNVDAFKTKGLLLGLAHGFLPWVVALIGLLLLLLGAFQSRRRSSANDES